MPRPVVVLTVEEKAAKYDQIVEQKRLKNQKYYETNPDIYRGHYAANKEKLNKRGCELKREKTAARKAAKAAASEAPCPGTPEVADV